MEAQVNLNQGLIAYYPFSGNANDVSGNNLHGLTRNGVQLTSDRLGNTNSAYLFDGIDDFIEVLDHPLLRFRDSFSISLLFARNSSCLIGELIEKRDWIDGSKSSFDFGLVNAGNVRTAIKTGDNCPDPLNGWTYPTVSNVTSPDQWHCVVATFKEGLLSFYLDGNFIGSSSTPLPRMDSCSGSNMRIGIHLSFDLLPFKGKIDEVRIYKRIINQEEIASICSTNYGLCTGSLGDPVVNITFGAGNNPGRPLPAIVPGASTTLTYVAVNGNPASPTPIDGQYTITNNVPFNFAWHSGIADHTPNDTDGYMAFYNSQETPGLEFYSQTITNLCGSTTYEFAAWIANCLNPAMMDGVDPDITFRIERPDGTVLGSYNTGAIPETNNLTWKQFGFFFTMPANETTVILKMINNSVGGTALPGNDLAIDDITFRPCGPSTIVSFSNSAQVDSLTICEGSSATLFGNLSTGFNTPNYRWQSSTDNGTSWTDIASSNVLQLPVTPAITGISRTIHYRMVAGDGNNINSANCRISSNKIILTIRILPIGGISGDSICPGQSGNITFTSSSLNSPFTISYSDGTGTLIANNMTNNGKIATGVLFNNKTYTLLSIKDALGCERTNGFNPSTADIEIRKSNFNAPSSPLSVCETKSVQLKGNNNTTFNYQWSPATYLDNPTSPSPISMPLASIQYTLRISEPVCNYDSTFLVNVNVNPSPIVVAQSANDIDCSLPTSQLQASGGVSYVWTPSAGLDNPTKANPIASVSNTTTFIVTGTDQFGCTDTSSVTVKVTNGGKPVFVLPNAFTPNGDGLNECFGIRRWGNVTIKEFSIFNRWGQRIFTTKNPSACWDGTFKGQKQDVGGYTYVIKASSFCGEVKKTGIVMLIR